jgi:hypothetical protein
MDRNLKHTLIWIGIVVIAIAYWISLYGCAHYDRTGHYVQTVTFQIHVVGDRTMYDYPPARNFNSGPAARNYGGYAKNTDPPQIWLTGYRDEKGVRVDSTETLGHEVLEVLRFADPTFANPHE